MNVTWKTPGRSPWAPASVLVLGLLVISCSSPVRVSSEAAPADDSAASWTPVIRDFFTRLARETPDAGGLDRLISESSLDFALALDAEPGPETLRAWLLELRTPHAVVEYRIGDIRVDVVDAAIYSIRFQLDRRAVDRQGIPHVARSENTWRIRKQPRDTPTVVRVESERLLAFPGTGPQIVCY